MILNLNRRLRGLDSSKLPKNSPVNWTITIWFYYIFTTLVAEIAFSNLLAATKRFFRQMMKKEEKISQLQNDLQESMKQLTIIKGILPKVTEERDMMWQEVKQCTEKNMLLNSEVSILKKKIEALDEDVLLKEGQITILKDTLGSKSFDLLASPDRTHEFLLE